MKVNVISESAFTVQGHGVHTAFTETIDALQTYTDYDVASNTDRASDVVHIHTVGPYALYKLLRSKGVRVISAHVTPDSFVGSLVGVKYWYWLAKIYLRWVYNLADGVLAVSSEVVDELGRLGVTKPVYLVPNTIKTELFANSKSNKAAARKKLGLSDQSFIVLGNGQVQPRKRIDTFIAVAKALPDVSFVWVGGIPFKRLAAASGEMEGLMESHPKNLTFTGLISRDDVVAYYQSADVFFLPSIQETFGIVIVEAAASGLPVLLRDIEQYKKTFGDGYERGDDDTFASQIRRFKSDRTYYDTWQKAAKKIATRYDGRVGAERLVEVYTSIMELKAKTRMQ